MEKLNVFISWSGEHSKVIARHIKEWLVDVVPNAKPWMSEDDIAKGAQWLTELNKSLSESSFGLLVLTPQNLTAPWLLFEAGVISKALPDQRCCPLLCDLKPTDVKGPLSQFQATSASSKEEMHKLALAMHGACEQGEIMAGRFEKWFERSWDELVGKIQSVNVAQRANTQAPLSMERTDRELIEEILQQTRTIAKQSEHGARLSAHETEPGSIVGAKALAKLFAGLGKREQAALFNYLAERRNESEHSSRVKGVRAALNMFITPDIDGDPEEKSAISREDHLIEQLRAIEQFRAVLAKKGNGEEIVGLD